LCTGHSRGRIYEALRRLVEKGVVREEPTRPIQFRPTPLAEILATARLRLTKQLAAVTAGQAVALASQGDVFLPLVAPTKPRDVRVLSGRRACHMEWSRMLATARSFFWLTGGARLTLRLAAMPSFLRELRAAHDRGLSVQVVLPRNAATSSALLSITGILGPDILHPATVDEFGPLVSCATDQASMEVISKPDDESLNKGDDVAIQVSSELFASANRKRRELAESFQQGEADAPYQWLAPNQGSEMVLAAIHAAKEDVAVLEPSQWSSYLSRDWERNRAAYADARTRGVGFRALTVRGENDPRDLEPLAQLWDIRVVSWHPVWLAIIDGEELYQAFTHPALGGPPQFRRSTEPNEVGFYAALFERLWATAEKR